MSVKAEIREILEFMQASSYPGPTPGQLWNIGVNFTPAMRSIMFPGWEDQEAEKKKFKDKNAKKRATLRKLAQWLQQNPST